eukprot:TRINITY_DN1632_c0_g1_i3.p1 TRINITY_DN1632_c0_g1~~TRINITY_DN1632_c0_g1_i3.p1  ORF type:complete len:284 (-),score=60.53 TRINITY_DN1632_c0_g1_i3:510-1361(-)
MLRSLVGSEMCIRDRHKEVRDEEHCDMGEAQVQELPASPERIEHREIMESDVETNPSLPTEVHPTRLERSDPEEDEATLDAIRRELEHVQGLDEDFSGHVIIEEYDQFISPRSHQDTPSLPPPRAVKQPVPIKTVPKRERATSEPPPLLRPAVQSTLVRPTRAYTTAQQAIDDLVGPSSASSEIFELVDCSALSKRHATTKPTPKKKKGFRTSLTSLLQRGHPSPQQPKTELVNCSELSRSAATSTHPNPRPKSVAPLDRLLDEIKAVEEGKLNPPSPTTPAD